jgi:hypothetical protein
MYEVIRRRGNGWIKLENYGLRPKPNSSVCSFDRLCITHIRSDVLCLRYLEIDPECFLWDDASEPLSRQVLGAAPARGHILETAYSCESIRVPFTGEMLLAANYIGRPETDKVPMISFAHRERSLESIRAVLERAPGILHPAYDYRNVLALVVANGTVIETRDLTVDMAALRCCTDPYSMKQFPSLERWLDTNDPEVKAKPIESSYGIPDHELWVQKNVPPLELDSNESRSIAKLIKTVFGGRDPR